MAMRPRTPTFGTHTPLRSVYDTFQPKSEMKENENAYFLHIYLSGFIKERIQINFVAVSRTLRIVGERPIIGGKKWSRFDESYSVPENIEVEKLQGKFEHGTLIVTMPKKLTQEVITTKEKVDAIRNPRTPKGTLSSKSPPTRVEEPFINYKKSPSPSTLGKGLNDLKKLKGTQKDNSRHQNIEDDEKSVLKAKEIIDTSATTSRGQKGNNNNNINNNDNNKVQKGQEEIKPKLKLILDDDEKIQEEIRQKALIEKVKRQLHEKDEDDEKESVTKKEFEEEEEEEKGRVTYESRKVDQKYIEHNMFLKGKEIKARKESTKGEESSISKAIEKGREISNIDKARKNNENEMYYTKGNGIKEVVFSASQVIKRIRDGKFSEKEKPLVANMGAAILVIVGLGAYVTYKFTSSSRT